MTSHTVVAGDTLSALAASYLGSPHRWPEIASANRLPDPDALAIGQRLAIPVDGDLAHATESRAVDALGPESAPLVLRLPSGWYVSSRWGWREFPGYPRHLHTGHDLAGMVSGSPIRLGVSVAVYRIGYDPDGYGYYVVIETDDGARWLLGHLAAEAPAVDRVVAGDTLALVGSTGASTGAHIHLERWSPGAPDFTARVDPEGLYRVESV